MIDILEEMSLWLRDAQIGGGTRDMVHRAREEIVALRDEKARWESLHTEELYLAPALKARADALEKAANTCEAFGQGNPYGERWTRLWTCQEVAKAIRAMKDRP